MIPFENGVHYSASNLVYIKYNSDDSGRQTMWKNYLISTLRNLRKYKGHSLINILGLAVGMAASLLIFLYVQHELSFDMFHEKAGRIQRVLLLDKSMGVSNTYAGITFVAMGPEIPKEVPEVEASVRLMDRGRQALKVGTKTFSCREMTLADPTVFKIFDFGLMQGDPETALVAPYSAAISRELAENMYGGVDDPIGKSFMWGENEVRVTGILNPIPENSHLWFDVLLSLNFPNEKGGYGENLRSWEWISAPTYFLLREGADEMDLEEKLIGVLRKNGVDENFAVTHQPLADTHLHSKNVVFDEHNRNKGDIGYVTALGAVAVFIMLIAVLNFMNLSTARSQNRAREVGMRKVVGAGKRQLFMQFMGESVVLSLGGIVMAFGMVILAGLPISSGFGLKLDPAVLARPPIMLGILAAALFTGLLAGIWPALVMSSFRPESVLRGAFKSRHGLGMRRFLVVVQFGISTALIISSGVVFQQMRYIKQKDLGYDRNQVLTFPLNREAAGRFEPLVEKLAMSSAILSWSTSDNVPGRTMNRTGIRPDGIAQDDPWVVSTMRMDEHFIETMGMTLRQGRNFSREFGTDAEEAVILNHSAADAIGWDDPLGKTFNQGKLKVIGVIDDFHFTNIRHVVEPLVIFFRPGADRMLSLKLKAGSIREAVEHLEDVWETLFPGAPLEYVFLDDEFEQIYRREENFGSLTRGFTVLAIFIAGLGLFGLVAHTVEQRTKEIGIRKVLGAGVGGLVVLLSRTYLNLVLLANLIAWPAAYFLMSGWLRDFAYRIELGLEIFLLSMAAAAVIAMLTVSFHCIRAAGADPVKALRYE